jgi:hypothetical protein
MLLPHVIKSLKRRLLQESGGPVILTHNAHLTGVPLAAASGLST